MKLCRSLLLALCALASATTPALAEEPFDFGLALAGRPAGYSIDVNSTIADLKADRASIYVNWSSLEPAQGEFDATAIDGITTRLDQYAQLGIKVTVVVIDAPAWANGGRTGSDVYPPAPAHLGDWQAFLSHVGGLWGPKVDAWQIWNEPNLKHWWGGQTPDPAAYAQLLAAAHAALKPMGETIYLGGLSGGDRPYFEAVLGAGGSGRFDKVSLHTTVACKSVMPDAFFHGPDGNLTPTSFVAYREIADAMADRGMSTANAIAILEDGIARGGASTCTAPGQEGKPSGVSAAQQAQYLEHAMACFAADGAIIDSVHWFSLQDVDKSGVWDHSMGLIDDDGTRQPAYDAFKRLASGGAPGAYKCPGYVDHEAPTMEVRVPQEYFNVLPISIKATDAHVMRAIDVVGPDGKEIGGKTLVSADGRSATWTDAEWFGARSLAMDKSFQLTITARDAVGNETEQKVTFRRLGPESGRTIVPIVTGTKTRLKGRTLEISGSFDSSNPSETPPAGTYIYGMACSLTILQTACLAAMGTVIDVPQAAAAQAKKKKAKKKRVQVFKVRTKAKRGPFKLKLKLPKKGRYRYAVGVKGKFPYKSMLLGRPKTVKVKK